MAEALLRHRLASAGVPGEVSSAGLWRADELAASGSVKAMAARGLDLSAHRSRLMSRSLLERADLIIGLEREHVREAAVIDPERFGRTFTLKELVRRGEAVGRATGTLDQWLAAVSAGRRPVDLLGASADDDVADPMGCSDAVFERTAVELSSLIDRLVVLVAGIRAEAVT
jgi:protein-tyrosine phosphatase